MAKKSFLSASQKREIKRAQDRLRRSPDFVKDIAKNQGVERLSVRGSQDEQTLSLVRARYINNNDVFTKRGFNTWRKELAEDTRLRLDQIDYILSQIDAQKMDFVQNSKLRYGSNPQLDYVLENATEIQGRYQMALEELQRFKEQITDDIF